MGQFIIRPLGENFREACTSLALWLFPWMVCLIFYFFELMGSHGSELVLVPLVPAERRPELHADWTRHHFRAILGTKVSKHQSPDLSHNQRYVLVVQSPPCSSQRSCHKSAWLV